MLKPGLASHTMWKFTQRTRNTRPKLQSYKTQQYACLLANVQHI